jgi:hypothetical protein
MQSEITLLNNGSNKIPIGSNKSEEFPRIGSNKSEEFPRIGSNKSEEFPRIGSNKSEEFPHIGSNKSESITLYISIAIFFLMFIGGVYKYFSEIQTYIIKYVLTDRRVSKIKREMQNIAEADLRSKTPVLNFIHKIEKYITEQTKPIIDPIVAYSLKIMNPK